jgi:molybdopterin/thiamine biosynthesis adenylyltransferase
MSSLLPCTRHQSFTGIKGVTIMAALVWSSLSILMVGAGGIGSALAPLLCRLRPARFTIQDDKKVREVNRINQHFGDTEVDRYKAEVLASKYYAQADTRRFSSGDPCIDDVVVSAVDSMESRRVLWQSVLSGGSRAKFFLD